MGCLPVIPTLVFCAALLVGVHLKHIGKGSAGVWIFKPLASAGFLFTALYHGALDSTYGILVLAALSVCWLGDVLLIPNSRRTLVAGMIAFMVGHALYAVAFVRHGFEVRHLVVGTGFAFAVGVLVVRHLWKSLDRRMRVPVTIYTLLISVMVGAAFGTGISIGPVTILIAALLFAASDAMVARNRFVKESFANQMFILPTYYAAQTMMALSVGGA